MVDKIELVPTVAPLTGTTIPDLSGAGFAGPVVFPSVRGTFRGPAMLVQFLSVCEDDPPVHFPGGVGWLAEFHQQRHVILRRSSRTSGVSVCELASCCIGTSWVSTYAATHQFFSNPNSNSHCFNPQAGSSLLHPERPKGLFFSIHRFPHRSTSLGDGSGLVDRACFLLLVHLVVSPSSPVSRSMVAALLAVAR